jgi:hypothetical protein
MRGPSRGEWLLSRRDRLIVAWHEVRWFFVPEGHMTVARRFIAGFASTQALEARVPEGRPNTAAHAQTEDPPSKLNRFSHGISIVPPGREQILNTSTGDKSPAYSLVVPPGHTATATASNGEMCNRDRSNFARLRSIPARALLPVRSKLQRLLRRRDCSILRFS